MKLDEVLKIIDAAIEQENIMYRLDSQDKNWVASRQHSYALICLQLLRNDIARKFST